MRIDGLKIAVNSVILDYQITSCLSLFIRPCDVAPVDGTGVVCVIYVEDAYDQNARR